MGFKVVTKKQILIPIIILTVGIVAAGIFFTMKEAQVLIERWRRNYNTIRPHSSLGYRPPAPEAIRLVM